MPYFAIVMISLTRSFKSKKSFNNSVYSFRYLFPGFEVALPTWTSFEVGHEVIDPDTLGA